MATVTLASLEAVRAELVKSKYYLNLRSGYMAPVTLHCSYGDSGHNVTFYIFDGESPAYLAGSSASIHGTRIDGASFGPFACTVDGNSVTFALQSSMTAVEGGGIAEITISKNGANVGTCNFGILVEQAVFPNGVAYDSDPSVYQDILRYVQSLQASTVYQAITQAVSISNAHADSAVAGEAALRLANDTALSNRISNLTVTTTGDSLAEVIDARTNFAGTTQNALKNRLNLFLEYTVVSSTTEV